jgi:hypothetical protein
LLSVADACLSLFLPLLKEVRMSGAKVFLVLVLGLITLASAFSTVVVPLAMWGEEYVWLWFAGLLFGTLVFGTLLTLFLRSEDRKLKAKGGR